MTLAELNTWLRYHDGAFPGFWSWYSQPAEQLAVRTNLWLNRLAQFEAASVMKQTEQMFHGRDKPEFFSGHLDWICNRLRPRPLLNDGDSMAPRKCGLCNDTGLVTVIYHRQRFTPGGCPLPDNTGAAACKCSKGTWLNAGRSAKGGDPLDVYDASQMDLPQPARLTDTERHGILSTLGMQRPDLAHAMAKLLKKTERQHQ